LRGHFKEGKERVKGKEGRVKEGKVQNGG